MLTSEAQSLIEETNALRGLSPAEMTELQVIMVTLWNQTRKQQEDLRMVNSLRRAIYGR
jgi:hypothetical protein